MFPFCAAVGKASLSLYVIENSDRVCVSKACKITFRIRSHSDTYKVDVRSRIHRIPR